MLFTTALLKSRGHEDLGRGMMTEEGDTGHMEGAYANIGKSDNR